MTLLEYKEKVDLLIQQYVDSKNDDIKDMLSYALDGGKRLRSIISLYIFENYGKVNNDVVVGIELLHNASLILDDLPCMDNDNYRRNRFSFHKKFGVKSAYLISNYLFSEFNKIIKNLESDYILEYVISKLKLIILGQYYDLFPHKNKNSTIEERISNNNLKTTPFFVLSFFIPLFLCKDKEVDINIIEIIGVSFSTSFQIYDDFLDIKQDEKTGNFNHIIVLGKSKSYSLYLKNLDLFRENMKKLNIKIELFEEIINYLNKKLEIHHNELQHKKI